MRRMTGSMVLVLALSVVCPTMAAAADEAKTQSIRALVIKECGSCHLPYKPKFLPGGAWEKIMASLKDHYGDVVSLPPDVAGAISKFYVSGGSWESWKVAPGQTLPRITTQPWWKRAMGDLDFKKPRIRSRSNCGACHTNADAYLAVPKDE